MTMLITGTDAHGHMGNFSRRLYHKLEEEHKNMKQIILNVKETFLERIIDVSTNNELDKWDKASAIHNIIVQCEDTIGILESIGIKQSNHDDSNYISKIKEAYLHKIIEADKQDLDTWEKMNNMQKLIEQCEDTVKIIVDLALGSANYVKVVEKEEQA